MPVLFIMKINWIECRSNKYGKIFIFVYNLAKEVLYWIEINFQVVCIWFYSIVIVCMQKNTVSTLWILSGDRQMYDEIKMVVEGTFPVSIYFILFFFCHAAVAASSLSSLKFRYINKLSMANSHLCWIGRKKILLLFQLSPQTTSSIQGTYEPIWIKRLMRKKKKAALHA